MKDIISQLRSLIRAYPRKSIAVCGVLFVIVFFLFRGTGQTESEFDNAELLNTRVASLIVPPNQGSIPASLRLTASLRNPAAARMQDSLVLWFDNDATVWNQVRVAQLFPVQVRLLGANQQPLLQLNSAEGFTGHEGVFKQLEQRDQTGASPGAAKSLKPRLIKETGNEIRFPINDATLRATTLVEVSFMEP